MKSPYRVLSRVCGMYYTNQATSTIAITNYSTDVQLAAFPILATLASAFDEYLIEKCEAWLIPPYFAPTEVASDPALFSSAVDLDDKTAPTTPIALAQKPGAQASGLSCGHYLSWQPRVASAVYNGAFTAYSDQGPAWIACTNPTVQHYGLKMSVSPTSQVITYNIVLRATVSFRGLAG